MVDAGVQLFTAHGSGIGLQLMTADLLAKTPSAGGDAEAFGGSGRTGYRPRGETSRRGRRGLSPALLRGRGLRLGPDCTLLGRRSLPASMDQ